METPSTGPPSEPDLQELLFRFLEDLDSKAAPMDELVESYCKEHPALQLPFRSSVRELVESGLVGDGDAGEVPDDYGGYRLQQRLGVGGMGAVYLAQHGVTEETVALKIVHSAELLIGGRSRFAREAEAVRSLDHPGIAKLLDANMDGDEPYLAFEYIEGQSLDAVIRRAELKEPKARSGEVLGHKVPSAVHPPWVAAATGAILQVAEALDHAHGRGVLHRDLKPANIIMGSSGKLILVDFGLATLTGAKRLTRTGAQLGSLPYMAPEQIRDAKSLTSEQSDVYSLGVTYYELLTLHHPFLGPNPESMRRRIVEGQCLSARDHAPDIPMAFNTVCMKAMEPDAAHRYKDVAAFAADLKRAMGREPIVARPPSLFRRARAWSRVRPGRAAGLAALTFLLIAGPLIYAAAVARQARHVTLLNEQLTSALTAAQESQARAEQSTRIARNSIMELSVRTASEKLSDVPGFRRVAHNVLLSSRRLYEELRENDPEDLGVLRDLAKLTRLDAVALYDMGEEDKAEAAFEEMNSAFDRLVDAGESRAEVQSMRASSESIRAVSYFNRFQFESAIAAAERAAEHCKDVLAEQPEHEKATVVMLRMYGLAASAAAYQGQTKAASKFAAAAQQVVDELLGQSELPPRLLLQISPVLVDLRTASVRADQPKEAAELSAKALECADRAIESNASSSVASGTRLVALSAHGDSLRLLGEYSEATRVLEEAKAFGEALVAASPEVESYAAHLAETLGRLALVKSEGGDEVGALREFEALYLAANAHFLERVDSDSRRSRVLLALLNCARFALKVPADKMEIEASHRRALTYVVRAREILNDVPEGDARAMGHLVVRLHREAARAHAALGETAAWDDLERMESFLPIGPDEAFVALRGYGFVLPLLDAGKLPPGSVDRASALVSLADRVKAHIEHFAQAGDASPEAVASALDLDVFGDFPEVLEAARGIQALPR